MAGARTRERVVVAAVAGVALLVLSALGGYLVLQRYEFVGLRPYRCRFVSGSVPTDSMYEVGLSKQVDYEGVDAPGGALAALANRDGWLVAARLRSARSHADLGVAVWTLDRGYLKPAAVNSLARRWSRIDAPTSESGGTEAKVVARCLRDDKYP